MEALLQNFHETIKTEDDVEQLKGLILRLAFEGNLVKQEPNDESAKVLLGRIQIEKERMIKDKIIKRTKILPITDQEKTFELPNGWEWARLSSVYDVRDGTHDTPKYVEEGIPLVTSKNISKGHLTLADVKYISKADHEAISQRSKVEKADILFAMIGSIGNPVIVDFEPNFSIKNVALFKYYSKQLSNPDFLHLFLLYAQGIMRENSSGAVQSFVSLSYLRNFIIPLPPLNEQKRIAQKIKVLFDICNKLQEEMEQQKKESSILNKSVFAKIQDYNNSSQLESLQFAIENMEHLCNTKEDINLLRNSVLSLAIQGKLVSQNTSDVLAEVLVENIRKEKEVLFKKGQIKKEKPLPPISSTEIPYKIPDSWKWIRLGEVIQLISGQHIKAEDYNDKGIGTPYLTGPSDFDGIGVKFTRWTESPKVIAKQYDLLVTVKGSGVGKMTVLDKKDAAIGRQIMAIRSILLDIEYVKILLSQFAKRLKELSVGIAIPGISREDILHLLIPLPPLEEQRRIVKRVEDLLYLADELNENIISIEKHSTSWLNTLLDDFSKENFKLVSVY
ncbi:restriction endonuclease subunit S [Bacillus thuringiensis]|uniref:restriction endonuclease subunit S n=1 Tax=Bacillus thuringiensis TaxID=1428 RepID=UPI000BF7D451|nr:restriction endonuclease subunit S [Bacillus thuringiensis]PFW42782.1 restriction endonuclease subunit S [Bacillus thuringiensis]